MVIELRVFKKKKKTEKVISDMSTFVLFFCIQFIFDVFYTVMSPKDVLIETESRKTVLPYSVICISRHRAPAELGPARPITSGMLSIVDLCAYAHMHVHA